MRFRITLCLIAVLINYVAYLSIRRTIITFLNSRLQHNFLKIIAVAILVVNLPTLLILDRQTDGWMYSLTPAALKLIFSPTTVWIETVITFLILSGPICMVAFLVKIISGASNKVTQRADYSPNSSTVSPAIDPVISRRGLLAGSAGLLIPGILPISAYSAYGSMSEIDIPAGHSIPIPYLPWSLEGLKIVQISDLHVGPFLGEDELKHVVTLVNAMNPDLVFITGDLIDRSLSDLPKALRGLKGIHCTFGTYAVLGNHDISSDPYDRAGDHLGGVNIANGLNSIGIQSLRNEVTYIGSGKNQLALLGLDWLSQPGDRHFYSYRQAETRKQLGRMMEQFDPQTPTILLAHHPDTFEDAAPLGIGLTLAGHTHGGQVVLANINGMPLGMGQLRYRYIAGLYKNKNSSLYVNRGIGCYGIPVRINCRPEISQFRLTANSCES